MRIYRDPREAASDMAEFAKENTEELSFLADEQHKSSFIHLFNCQYNPEKNSKPIHQYVPPTAVQDTEGLAQAFQEMVSNGSLGAMGPQTVVSQRNTTMSNTRRVTFKEPQDTDQK